MYFLPVRGGGCIAYPTAVSINTMTNRQCSTLWAFQNANKPIFELTGALIPTEVSGDAFLTGFYFYLKKNVHLPFLPLFNMKICPQLFTR